MATPSPSNDGMLTMAFSESDDTDGAIGKINAEGAICNIDTEGAIGNIDIEGEIGNIDIEGEIRNIDTEGESGNIVTEGETGNIDTESETGNIYMEGEAGNIDTEGETGTIVPTRPSARQWLEPNAEGTQPKSRAKPSAAIARLVPSAPPKATTAPSKAMPATNVKPLSATDIKSDDGEVKSDDEQVLYVAGGGDDENDGGVALDGAENDGYEFEEVSERGDDDDDDEHVPSVKRDNDDGDDYWRADAASSGHSDNSSLGGSWSLGYKAWPQEDKKTARGTKRRGGRKEQEHRKELMSHPQTSESLARFYGRRATDADIRWLTRVFGGAALDDLRHERDNLLWL